MGFERGVFGRLLREPLLHFLLIGMAVFAVYRFAGPPEPENDRGVIDVTTAQEERLAGQFESVWRRPPTRGELDGLVEDHIREEIYYREGLALGLDRDDTVTLGYHAIAGMARTGSNQPDKRASAVEIATSHNVPLKGNVPLAVIPRQYLDDDGKENVPFIDQLKALGIVWRTYEWQPNTAPNELQEEIARIVRRYFAEAGLLS